MGRALSSGRLTGHWEGWPPGQTAVVAAAPSKRRANGLTGTAWRSVLVPVAALRPKACLKLAGTLIRQEGDRRGAG